MKIEMDTVHPEATKIQLTPYEVGEIYDNLEDEDTLVTLGYQDMNPEKPYAEFQGPTGKTTIALWEE